VFLGSKVTRGRSIIDLDALGGHAIDARDHGRSASCSTGCPPQASRSARRGASPGSGPGGSRVRRHISTNPRPGGRRPGGYLRLLVGAPRAVVPAGVPRRARHNGTVQSRSRGGRFEGQTSGKGENRPGTVVRGLCQLQSLLDNADSLIRGPSGGRRRQSPLAERHVPSMVDDLVDR